MKNSVFSIFYFLLLCLILPLSFVSNSNFNESKNLSNLGFDYVVETSLHIENNDSLFKQKNINLALKNSKSAPILTYFQLNNKYQPSFATTKLKENEVIISSNLAKKLNINVNESINLDLLNYEESKEFIVKDLIDITHDFYSVNNSQDYSLVILGYNKSLIEGSKGVYVNFFKEREHEEFKKKDIAYSLDRNLNSDYLFYDLNGAIYLVIESLLLISFTIINIELLLKKLKKENRKYLLDNYGYKDVSKLTKEELLLYNFIPLTIYEIIYSILAIISITSLFGSIINFVILITSLLIIFKRKIFYVKDNF